MFSNKSLLSIAIEDGQRAIDAVRRGDIRTARAFATLAASFYNLAEAPNA